MMRFMSFFLALAFAVVTARPVPAQAPPSTGEAFVRIYEVFDLMRGDPENPDSPAIGIDDLIAYARARSGASAEQIPGGAAHGMLIVTAPDAVQKKVESALREMRDGTAPPWRLKVVTGRLAKPWPGIDPKDVQAPFAVNGPIEFRPAGTTDAASPETDSNSFIKFASLMLSARTGDSEKSAEVEIRGGWAGTLSVTPLRPRTLDLAKTRRFVTGYRIENDVEGHPAGIAVPEITSVKDGITVRAVIVPDLSEPATKVMRAKVVMTIEESSIAPEIATRETKHGTIRIPIVTKRTSETSIVLSANRAVVLPLGANGDVLIVQI